MVYLCNGHLPVGTSEKMKNKKYSPCKIIKKINDNAYVVDLSENFGISSTFNVADIFEYFPSAESNSNSRMSCFQEREIDVGAFPQHSMWQTFEYFPSAKSDSNLRMSCFQEMETDVGQFTHVSNMGDFFFFFFFFFFSLNPKHNTQESTSELDITPRRPPN
jgi:hypothetical protein